MAADINELQTAIVAIETELGTDPAGSATDVTTRLAQSLDASGNLAFADATTLTISSGAVTATQNYHAIDTEGAAASDDLDTISGITDDGFFLLIRAVNSAHNIVIKHDTGNIHCAGGVDITLDAGYDFAVGVYCSALTGWIVLSAGTLTAAATLSGTNTWTGANTWNAAVAYKYSALSTNTTLDGTHYAANVDATSGGVTITLPTAVGITGRHYIIRKLDSSANAVTVDGNGSETINGATTYSLSSQYQVVSLMSDGAGWMVL